MTDKYGFIRVASCSPAVKPADIHYNLNQIKQQINLCVDKNVDIAVFPELSITGYTCMDLFAQRLLIEKASEALLNLTRSYEDSPITLIVGLPVEFNGALYNCAAVVSGGKIKGIVPKSHIPNYGEFYEKRWFKSGLETSSEIEIKDTEKKEVLTAPFGSDLLFKINGVICGIEICEDLWVPIPPSSYMALNGATLIFNLSATNELIGKYTYLKDLISNQSARCRCGYVYASAGFGESSTDLAFAGHCIIAENGKIIEQSPRFDINDKLVITDLDIDKLKHDRIKYETFHSRTDTKDYRIIEINTANDYEKLETGKYVKIDSHPFLDEDKIKFRERCDEITSIQAWGLAVRLKAINCRKAIIGISGGLDSTLALLVAVKAFDMLGYDRKGIIGVSMPGFGTTERTKSNADKLIDLLGVSHKIIPINKVVEQHFKDIDHDPSIHDATYENSQARMRTMILMDLANKENGIVIGTGDLSELALGWCTYNGDQMSMYGVNSSVPKTLVKYLVEHFAEQTENVNLRETLSDIINTPISPELLPPDENNNIDQKTEDLVGPYELHDFFLYHLLRYGTRPEKIKLLANKAFEGKYSSEIIEHWLKVFYKRFFNQQFKRSAMPDGIKAGSICLSPRGDWRMPSDASSELFIEDLN